MQKIIIIGNANKLLQQDYKIVQCVQPSEHAALIHTGP